jgi:DNA/RNA endonuclease YhcR with UshA esterase domain
MKFLLIILLILAAFTGHSQTQINLEDVSKHINDSVTVCGKVASGRYMDQTNRKLTLLNVGAAFPNQVFTIDNDLRSAFETVPETFFLEKEVCVTGRVTLYRDAPQIIIYRKDQILVK